VMSLTPGCSTTLRLDMVAPQQPGIYESKWRMSTNTGSFFGGKLPTKNVLSSTEYSSLKRDFNLTGHAGFKISYFILINTYAYYYYNPKWG